MHDVTSRPETRQPHYGEHLGDAAYWGPFVREVLRRHGLSAARIESGFVGTFPTFVAGDVVVKLFGDVYAGATAHETEVAMNRLLAGRTSVPVPDILATGGLFDDSDAWRWPYLVQARLGGTPWRAARLTDAQATTVADDLGRAIAELHRLPPPPGARFDPSRLQALRAAADQRLRRTGWLPTHLLNQIPAYLRDAPPATVVVHADLTSDHVFVDGGRLVGIIDWGDAMLADRSYELIALYLGCLDLNRRRLQTFLDGYRWPASTNFKRRAMQAALTFEFDAFSKVTSRVDLGRTETLGELADELFDLE